MKRANFKLFFRKLVSTFLALIILFNLVPIVEKAEAADVWTDSINALCARLAMANAYHTITSYQVSDAVNAAVKLRVIQDTSGNSSIWHIAEAFYYTYLYAITLTNANPNLGAICTNPQFCADFIWETCKSSHPECANYAGAYKLLCDLAYADTYTYVWYPTKILALAPGYLETRPCYVQIVRDQLGALRDYDLKSMDALPSTVITSFSYGFNTGCFIPNNLFFNYINGSLSLNPVDALTTYQDTSYVKDIKDYINFFFTGKYDTWDFEFLYNSFSEEDLLALANNGNQFCANINLYLANDPYGSFSNLLNYWILVQSGGINGKSTPADVVDQYWVTCNGGDLTPYVERAQAIRTGISDAIQACNYAYWTKHYANLYVNYLNVARTPGFYNPYDLNTMKALYETSLTYYAGMENAIDTLTQLPDLRSYLETYAGYDADATFAYLTQLQQDIATYDIRIAKVGIDTIMATYGKEEYTPELQDNYGTRYNLQGLTNELLAGARDQIIGYSTALNNFADAGLSDYVNSLFPEDDARYDLVYIQSINWELIRRNAAADYVNYYAYFVPRMSGDYASSSTAELENIIYTDAAVLMQLNDAMNRFSPIIGTAVDQAYPPVFDTTCDNLYAEATKYIASLFDILNRRLLIELDTVLTYMQAYGNEINFNNYSQFKKLVDHTEADIYLWLDTYYSDWISSELEEKYEAFTKLYLAFQEFGNKWAPENMVKADLSESYPTRVVFTNDFARQSGEDYVVTKEKLQNMLLKTDSYLLSSDFASLIEIADPSNNIANLSDYIDATLGNKVFSDKMVNQIIEALFPMLADELSNTISGLVDEINTGAGYDLSTVVDDLSGHIKLAIDEETHTYGGKTYPKKDLPTVFESLGLYLYPSSLAKVLGNYPAIAAVLSEAGRSWENVSFDFDWGIDSCIGTQAKYQRFCSVIECIFNSALPIFQTLLSGNSFKANIVDAAYGYNADTLAYTVSLAGLSYDIRVKHLGATANIDLSVEPMYVYQDVWIPMLEALGLNTVAHPYTFAPLGPLATAENMVHALFDPFYELILELTNAPVTRILEILPTLSYFISFDSISDLIGKQSLTAAYSVDLKINRDECTLLGSDELGWVLASLLDSLDVLDNIVSGTESLRLGDYFDLSELLRCDATDINAVVHRFAEMVGFGSLQFPVINPENLVSFSTATAAYPTQRRLGSRIYLTADTADVFFKAFGWLVSALGSRSFIDSIVSEINAQKLENGKNPIELPGTLYQIIESISKNTDDALCSLVELTNPQTYAYSVPRWFNEFEYEKIDGVTPASTVYLNYGNNWTKDKAEYIVTNFKDIIAGVLEMAGAADTSPDLLFGNLVSGFATNRNLTTIMRTLCSLGDSLDAKTVKMIYDETGVDLSLWANAFGSLLSETAKTAERGPGLSELSYDRASGTWSYQGKAFTDGSIAEFGDILTYALSGFAPIAGLLLMGQDISLLGDIIHITGYDGYEHALVGLFEAIGIKHFLSPQNFKVTYASNPTAGFNYVIKTLLARFNTIAADPINELTDTLPGLIYYLESNGLSVAVKNLFRPLLVLADTLRPLLGDLIDLDKTTSEYTDVPAINIHDLSLETLLLFTDSIQAEKNGIALRPVLSPALRAFCVDPVINGTSFAPSTSYTVHLDKADTLTLLLTSFIELLQYGDNAKKLDKLWDTKGLLPALLRVFNAPVTEMMEPNWAYSFLKAAEGDDGYEYDADFDYSTLLTPIDLSPYHTINYLRYDTDWQAETAQYLDDNLDSIVLELVKLIDPDAKSVTDFLADLDIYSAETIAKIAGLLHDVAAKVDSRVLGLLDKLAGTDILKMLAYSSDAAAYSVTDRESFREALLALLEPLSPVWEFMLLGQNQEYFQSSGLLPRRKAGTSVITLTGAEGYAYGLVPLLEALGCTPASPSDFYEKQYSDDSYTCTLLSEDSALSMLGCIIDSLCDLIDGIMADPINETLALLPNLIYFVNAGGLTASVNNICKSLLDIVDAIGEIDGEMLDVDELLGFHIDDLSFSYFFSLINEKMKQGGKRGLNLSAAIGDKLESFYIGSMQYYTSANGRGAFRMIYNESEDRKDMLTILISFALESIRFDEENAAALDDLLGTGTLFENAAELFGGLLPKYRASYTDYYSAYPEPNQLLSYLTYANDWKRSDAKWLDGNLDSIIDAVLAALDIGPLTEFTDSVLYSDKTVNAVVNFLNRNIQKLDSTLLRFAGKLIGCDFETVLNAEEVSGVQDKASFVDALSKVIAPAEKLIGFLCLEENYAYFNQSEDGEEILSIFGGAGYEMGLKPLLDALGCDTSIIITDDSHAFVVSLLTCLCDQLDAFLADPANTVLDLLPQLIYYVNAGGLQISAYNLLAPVLTIAEHLSETFDLDLSSLTSSIDSLRFDYLFALLTEKTGIEIPDTIIDALEHLFFGRFDESSGKVVYTAQQSRADMLTILISMALDILKYGDNAILLGEDVSALVKALQNTGEAEMREIAWLFKEKADSNETFSLMETTEEFTRGYGVFTEYMANQIALNFADFLDDLIALLGIEVNGKVVFSFRDLLSNTIGTTIYSAENLQNILDQLFNFTNQIRTMAGSAYLVDAINQLLDVDLGAYETLQQESTELFRFDDGDRTAFTQGLAKILRPLYPLLKWLLCNQDIAFFVDKEGTDAVLFYGAEGYQYGIIPILEALQCKNVKTAEDYAADVAKDPDTLLTDILDPFLDRIDEILLDPANELLSLLPNIIYFVNSKGLDACLNNLLHALNGLLDVLEPVVEFDLNDLIAIPLDIFTFESITAYLLDLVESKTGYRLDAASLNEIAELTAGKLVSFQSQSGQAAYRMVHSGIESESMLITALMRILTRFIANDNAEQLKGILQDSKFVSRSAYRFYAGLIDTISYYFTTSGVDITLCAAYSVFSVADLTVGSAAKSLSNFNKRYEMIYNALANSDLLILRPMAEYLKERTKNNPWPDIFSERGIAPNGLIRFTKQITDIVSNTITRLQNIVKSIVQSIRNLFVWW